MKAHSWGADHQKDKQNVFTIHHYRSSAALAFFTYEAMRFPEESDRDYPNWCKFENIF